MTAATIDEVAKTLAEFEVLAQKSGEWDGADPVEFSIDGYVWLPVWAPVGDWRFPPFARATVRRKGVSTPTTMVVAWDESVPADDDWRALWERKPMKLFGSFALRSSIRHAFRDLVGDLRGPDEDGPTIGDPWAPAEAAYDWDAELAACTWKGQVHRLHGEAKRVRAVTPQLESAFRRRLAELPETEPTPELSADERIRHDAFFPMDRVQGAFEAAGGAGAVRREPQDHLPGNRAARRATARRKGGRR